MAVTHFFRLGVVWTPRQYIHGPSDASTRHFTNFFLYWLTGERLENDGCYLSQYLALGEGRGSGEGMKKRRGLSRSPPQVQLK